MVSKSAGARPPLIGPLGRKPSSLGGGSTPATPAAHLIATSAVGAAASVTVSASGLAVEASTLSTPGASTAWLASAVVSRRFGVVEMSTAPGAEAGSQVPQPSGSSATASGVAATLTF